MRKSTILAAVFFHAAVVTYGQSIRLITQFINPCGLDGGNEFIIGLANTPINVGNLGFASINHTSVSPIVQPDFNWYWYGKNVINAPRPTFTPSLENCGVSGSGLSCFRILDPGTPADATTIDNVRTTLNTIAGCPVFQQVPATGIIPGGLFSVFLGAGGCGLDVPATNLNFSNHCSGSTPIQQYYLVVGNGAYTPLSACSGGYFVNSNGSSRTSVIYNYTGGGNTIPANYQSSNTIYTNGPAPSAGNAGVIVPTGSGGSIWVNNYGCVPSPMVILDEKTFSITGLKKEKDQVTLKWQMVSSSGYDYFSLERSFNGVVFSELKNEKAERSGDTYSGVFTDDLAIAPLLYYRIKSVAMDGKIAYSNMKVVSNLGAKRMAVFPNPFSDHFTIESSADEPVIVTISDITGRELMKRTISTRRLEVDAARWAPGFYTIRLSGTGGEVYQTQKFIKQN